MSQICSRGALLITARRRRNFLGGILYLPLGNRNKNMIFERFRKSTCAAGEKNTIFFMYNVEKSMVFGPPQAENFWQNFELLRKPP